MNKTSEMLKLKKNVFRSSNFGVVLFVLIVFSSLILAVFSAYSNEQYKNDVKQLPTMTRWSLLKIIESGSVEGTFDLVVINEVGGVKEISEVLTWGLSNNKTLLVAFTTRGLQIHDLNRNAFSVVPIDGRKPTGMIREGISFGKDDLNFAFSAFTDADKKLTEIFVFNVGGELIARFSADIYHDGTKVAKASLSKSSNLILTRTIDPTDLEFTKPDGTAYNLAELPIKLSVFNLTGEKIHSFDVRDYGSADDRVVYKWDYQHQSVIDFVIFNKNDVPDLSDFDVFSKIALN